VPAAGARGGQHRSFGQPDSDHAWPGRVSADGCHGWTELASFPSGKRLAASLTQPGIYPAVRKGSGTSGPFTSRSTGGLAAILAGVAAVVVVASVLALLILRRRR
jgi:hypothetical protein